MSENRRGRRARPGFSDIDAFGLSHQGLMRRDNQDHFFLGALIRRDQVEAVTEAEADRMGDDVERLASLAVVADGVGGVTDGGEAARVAVRELINAIARFYQDRETTESEDPDAPSRLLQDAALSCHESLLQRAHQEGGKRRFATTLTLFLGFWPHAYLLQVGDSRCYVFKDGDLSQITRDQTMAQDLVDSGALTRTVAERSRWANVLSSAIGGHQAAPVVTRVVRDWGTVVLLCSDGLTKHVPDEKIKERLATMTSSRQVAEQLLRDALDGGGTDNITVIIGRTLPPDV